MTVQGYGVCTIDDCLDPIKNHMRRLCNKHYHKWRKYGDPLGSRTITPAPLYEMSTTDAAWLAGFMEGEGTFYTYLGACYEVNKGDGGGRYHYFRTGVRAVSTDKDVLNRAAELMDAPKVHAMNSPTRQRMVAKGHKPAWQMGVTAKAKVDALCLLLFPHMGERRQAAIANILEANQLHREGVDKNKECNKCSI